MSTLNDIFSELLCMETITVSDLPPPSYASLRSSLLRKFKKHSTLSASLGLDDYAGFFLSCEYNADTNTATFKVAENSTRKRKQIEYNVTKL